MPLCVLEVCKKVTCGQVRSGQPHCPIRGATAFIGQPTKGALQKTGACAALRVPVPSIKKTKRNAEFGWHSLSTMCPSLVGRRLSKVAQTSFSLGTFSSYPRGILRYPQTCLVTYLLDMPWKPCFFLTTTVWCSACIPADIAPIHLSRSIPLS